MSELTVGDLRRQLEGLPANTKLIFDGGMTFNRLKRWADDEFIVEFANPHADLSPKFRKDHPEVLVVYCRYEPLSEATRVDFVPRF